MAFLDLVLAATMLLFVSPQTSVSLCACLASVCWVHRNGLAFPPPSQLHLFLLDLLAYQGTYSFFSFCSSSDSLGAKQRIKFLPIYTGTVKWFKRVHEFSRLKYGEKNIFWGNLSPFSTLALFFCCVSWGLHWWDVSLTFLRKSWNRLHDCLVRIATSIILNDPNSACGILRLCHCAQRLYFHLFFLSLEQI